MLFSKLSVVVFAVLVIETLASSPGRYARRSLKDEISQPTPAITPAPILPATKLKARAESTSSGASEEEDGESTYSGGITSTKQITGTSSSDNEDPTSTETYTSTSRHTSSAYNSKNDIEMDEETTTIRLTYTSPRTITTFTTYMYDRPGEVHMSTEYQMITAKNMSTARPTGTSSGHTYIRSYLDNTYGIMDEETSSVEMTSAYTTELKSIGHLANYSRYTYTTSDFSEDYPVSTTKEYMASRIHPSTGYGYPYESSTAGYGYVGQPKYTTLEPSSSSPTPTAQKTPNPSQTNAVDSKIFKSTFGDPNAATIDCLSMPEGAKQGVSVKDLINILKKPDGNVYNIDRSGCFQAKCIGDYGVLRLCNLMPKTRTVTFNALEIKVFISLLLRAIRPNWESEISINFNELVYQPDAITFCGSSEITPQQMPKPKSPFPQNKPKAQSMPDNRNPNSGTWSDTERIKMPLSFQPRFPNYWGENLGIPVARDAKFNGIISNGEKGWAIVIDSSSKEDLKCNSANNFKKTCGTGREKDAEGCIWDNTIPKPYFVGDDTGKD
ncbi:hypothetical protein TWF718_003726 [Orbilia javanica]|uniref:Uncharacterized protein n=1 Tax=Orbilia javanica TaxID=47235 RepID=A0AAN8N4J7_9PEZI